MASLALLNPVKTTFDSVGDLIADSIAGERVEVAALAYCDRAGRVLGMRHVRSGLTGALDLPIRRIAIDALAFDAAVLVMAHNHPSGQAWPSRADRATTRRIAELLHALGVRLHDHLIVGYRGAKWSFRAAGLL